MRITNTQLQAIVNRINDITKSPKEAYTKKKNKYVANIGNFHLDFAYGGVALHRMYNDAGGVEDIFNGHHSKKDLAEKMWAFIRGLTFKKGKLK